MHAALVGALLVILFFSIRGIISLFIILWAGKKIKKYFDKKKAASEEKPTE